MTHRFHHVPGLALPCAAAVASGLAEVAASPAPAR